MLDSEEFERRRWRVAVLADEARQGDLIDFLRRHRELVMGWSFVSTEPTATAIARELVLRVRREVPALHADLAEGAIDALIVLRAREEDGPTTALLSLADALNVPVATNLGSARCLVLALAPRGRPTYRSWRVPRSSTPAVL